MAEVRRWAELRAPAISATFAAAPDTVVLVPVGATEQHGPHLPVGTDTILATALCDAVSAKTGAVVCPPLPIGASWWHGSMLGGTLGASGEEVAASAVAVALGAAASGARRLLFVNGHVGNGGPLGLACDHLRRSDEVAVGVVEWWSLSPTIHAEVVADAEDWHANRAETSLMMVVAPGLVDDSAALHADDPDRSAGLVFRYRGEKMSRTGVTGRPSEADVESGARLWAQVVDAAVAVTRRAAIERPPLG